MTEPEEIDVSAISRRVAESVTAPVAKAARSHPQESVIAEQLEPIREAIDALIARLESLEGR